MSRRLAAAVATLISAAALLGCTGEGRYSTANGGPTCTVSATFSTTTEATNIKDCTGMNSWAVRPAQQCADGSWRWGSWVYMERGGSTSGDCPRGAVLQRTFDSRRI